VPDTAASSNGSVLPAGYTPAAFDHQGPEYARGWEAIGRHHRAECPVARSEQHGGFWVVSRYADVERVIKDDVSFSSEHLDAPSPRQGVVIPGAPLRQIPIEMDPPDYTPFRTMLNSWFSPGASRAWEPQLRDITTAFVNRFIEKGAADLVLDLANPVPAVFTAMLLGLPVEDWRFYSDPMHEMVAAAPDSEQRQQALIDYMACVGKVLETAKERRDDPREDLLSMLVTTEVEGRPLTDQQVLEISSLVLIGGVDTTTSVIANAFLWLSEHPEERAWLAEDPTRLRLATEELLRYFTPTQALARTVTCPVNVGGVDMEPGDRVLMSFAFANRDEAEFPNPDAIDLARSPNRHQSFGLGIHRCIGSTFARMEIELVLGEVLRRLPDFVVDRAASHPYGSVGVVNGYVDMPATFTPGDVVPCAMSF
jgi:cytochrome P450